MENKELEEKMVNLYLDGYEPDGHGSCDAGATPVGDGNGSISRTWELVWRMSYDYKITKRVVDCTLFSCRVLFSMRFYLYVFNEAAYFVTNNSF
jgi:hypothetical protein